MQLGAHENVLQKLPSPLTINTGVVCPLILMGQLTAYVSDLYFAFMILSCHVLSFMNCKFVSHFHLQRSLWIMWFSHRL